MNKSPSSIFTVESSDVFARHSLSKVGYEAVSHGHWLHHLFAHYNKWGPTEWLIIKLNDI